MSKKGGLRLYLCRSYCDARATQQDDIAGMNREVQARKECRCQHVPADSERLLHLPSTSSPQKSRTEVQRAIAHFDG